MLSKLNILSLILFNILIIKCPNLIKQSLFNSNFPIALISFNSFKNNNLLFLSFKYSSIFLSVNNFLSESIIKLFVYNLIYALIPEFFKLKSGAIVVKFCFILEIIPKISKIFKLLYLISFLSFIIFIVLLL